MGIDDSITAIWISGLILSLSFVIVDWVKKKWPKLKSKYYYFPTFILMYLFVLVPLKISHTIGILRNTIWGIDKIILGIFAGSIVFLIGIWADKKVRKIKGKQLFVYQKVVFPVLALIVASLIFYFIAR